jgi:hypothetical protein
MLLAAAGSIAAIALPAGGAQAQEGGGHHSGAFVGVPEGPVAGHAFRRDCDNRRCRFDRNEDAAVVMDWYGGEWARWNNRTWQATSYNDWWHEEPWRAYPAWMRRNQDCTRHWYAGDTLRC